MNRWRRNEQVEEKVTGGGELNRWRRGRGGGEMKRWRRDEQVEER